MYNGHEGDDLNPRGRTLYAGLHLGRFAKGGQEHPQGTALSERRGRHQGGIAQIVKTDCREHTNTLYILSDEKTDYVCCYDSSTYHGYTSPSNRELSGT